MTVYFILIIAILLLCWIHEKVISRKRAVVSDNITVIKDKRDKYKFTDKKIIWAFIFVAFAFVAAFRYKVGTDFHAYYRTELWSNKFAKGDFTDPGFTIFAIIADFLFQGRNGGLTILAAIVTTALFVFTIAKRSENMTLSLLLFIFIGCYTGMFNGVRQYLAAGILFAGFRFVQEKKCFKWLLIVLLAATVHITAILMFFVYFACNLKFNFMTVVLYAVIAVVLLFLYEPLWNLVGVLKQEEMDTDIEWFNRSVNVLRVIVQCVPLLLSIFVSKNKINEDADCKMLFNVCLLNAAIAVASINSVYFARFFIYTMPFQILMYPKMLNKMEKNTRKIFTALLIVFYAAFWLYEVSNSSSLNNFQWIFTHL